MIMSIYYIDTSAIMNGALSLFDHTHTYISPLVLMELENIKTNGNEHSKYLARQAIREIIESKNLCMTTISQKKIAQKLKKYNFLMDINDHKIICEALILKEYNSELKFITSDCAQYLFARTLNLDSCYFNQEKEYKNNDYCGWSKHYPNEEQMALLYSNPEKNILNAKINEFVEIFEGTELKDVLFWNGTKYRPLNYKDFNTGLGEKIKPRNLEQKMYMDLLQNNDIPIKLCISKFGTGKSYLALSYALNEIHKGRFDKIIFVKNNLEVKGAGVLGKEVAHLYSNILD